MIVNIENIRQYVMENGVITQRDRGITRELLSFTATLDPKLFKSYDKSEITKYMNMLEKQIPIFRKELKKNRYSRRLFFQFDRFHKNTGFKDFFLCIESFGVFFHDSKNYDLIINFRSSDIDRLESDVSMIREIARKAVSLENTTLKKIKIHCFSLHAYEKSI